MLLTMLPCFRTYLCWAVVLCHVCAVVLVRCVTQPCMPTRGLMCMHATAVLLPSTHRRGHGAPRGSNPTLCQQLGCPKASQSHVTRAHVPREAERVKEGRVGARVGHLLFAPCRLSVESFTARGYLMHTQSSDASSGVVSERQTGSNLARTDFRCVEGRRGCGHRVIMLRG